MIRVCLDKCTALKRNNGILPGATTLNPKNFSAHNYWPLKKCAALKSNVDSGSDLIVVENQLGFRLMVIGVYILLCICRSA